MKMREEEKIFYAKGNQRKARVASYIIKIKLERLSQDKEEHYIMIKRSI